MFRTIVAGVDGTPGAADAAGWAAALARLTGAELVVASAYPSNPLTVRVRTPFNDRTPAQAQADLLGVNTAPHAPLGARFVPVEGASVHQALHRLALRERADLIVVGRSRHPAAFVHGSPCAVALVPRGTRRCDLARVGVACDGSSASRSALNLARDLAALPVSPVRRLDLVLVEPPGLRYHLELEDPGLFVREPSAAAGWLDRVAHEPAGHARVRSLRRIGDPATELHDAVGRLGPAGHRLPQPRGRAAAAARQRVRPSRARGPLPGPDRPAAAAAHPRPRGRARARRGARARGDAAAARRPPAPDVVVGAMIVR